MNTCGDRKLWDIWLAQIGCAEIEAAFGRTPRGDWLLILLRDLALRTPADRTPIMQAYVACAKLAAETIPDGYRKKQTLVAIGQLEELEAPVTDADIDAAVNLAVSAARRSPTGTTRELGTLIADKVREFITWDMIGPRILDDENGCPQVKGE